MAAAGSETSTVELKKNYIWKRICHMKIESLYLRMQFTSTVCERAETVIGADSKHNTKMPLIQNDFGRIS